MGLNISIDFLTSHLPGSRGWSCHSHVTWANRRGTNLGTAPRPVRRDRSTSAPINPSCQKTFLWAGIWQPVCKRSLWPTPQNTITSSSISWPPLKQMCIGPSAHTGGLCCCCFTLHNEGFNLQVSQFSTLPELGLIFSIKK